MKSFDPFLSRLGMIRDPRRAEGKFAPYFAVFHSAIVTGANSYRGIRTFIKAHLKRLNKAFEINWKRPPAHLAQLRTVILQKTRTKTACIVNRLIASWYLVR